MMMVMRSQTERRSRHLQGPSSVLRLLYAEKFCCLVAHYSFRNTLPLLKHFPILHYIRLCKGLPCLPCFAPLFALRWTCGAAHVTHSPPTLPITTLSSLVIFFLSQLWQLSRLWILFSDVCCQNVTLAPPTRTTYNTYYHIFEIYTFVLANIFFFQPLFINISNHIFDVFLFCHYP